VKLRFIDRFADRLDDPESLRRAAYLGSRRDLAAFTRSRAWISRDAGLRALGQSVFTQPSVVTHVWAWRALGKILLGPPLSARLTR
jgi:hypothetical protein